MIITEKQVLELYSIALFASNLNLSGFSLDFQEKIKDLVHEIINQQSNELIEVK